MILQCIQGTLEAQYNLPKLETGTHHQGHAPLFPCLLAPGSEHFNHAAIAEGQLRGEVKKKIPTKQRASPSRRK